ncbi:MAG: hypothetical protein M1833_001433 [Piccolia ochrophora]|nr:MAG: hypothetical protein M1833_001433 [Piccolia ochrophora]
MPHLPPNLINPPNLIDLQNTAARVDFPALVPSTPAIDRDAELALQLQQQYNNEHEQLRLANRLLRHRHRTVNDTPPTGTVTLPVPTPRFIPIASALTDLRRSRRRHAPARLSHWTAGSTSSLGSFEANNAEEVTRDEEEAAEGSGDDTSIATEIPPRRVFVPVPVNDDALPTARSSRLLEAMLGVVKPLSISPALRPSINRIKASLEVLSPAESIRFCYWLRGWGYKTECVYERSTDAPLKLVLKLSGGQDTKQVVYPVQEPNEEAIRRQDSFHRARRMVPSDGVFDQEEDDTDAHEEAALHSPGTDAGTLSGDGFDDEEAGANVEDDEDGADAEGDEGEDLVMEDGGALEENEQEDLDDDGIQ